MTQTEHNSVELIWAPGHVGIDGNEIDNEQAREGFSHPLVGPKASVVYLQRLPWESSGAVQAGT